ncbi:PLC-like phosphodiesterase [Polychaeton citri CBS 116435]|uniref:PLC-like phosphodiesterase n=1 Tax=Polychaeton citri CBS 116435 TaxID=1314669 RepID=A0A9P4QDL2_9PEZI|nr:PLC-like phosphodiesterase [Polychaeton citri CBS 116435]
MSAYFLKSLFLLPTLLRATLAQSTTATSASTTATSASTTATSASTTATSASTTATSSASIACNNSPDLCSQQYNRITHLGAHDSPFLNPDGSQSAGNQKYNTTIQLSAGVRLLSGQVHYVSQSSSWHMCHTSCDLLDAGTLSDWLGEIKAWMDDNPNEVVTVLLVNADDATAQQLADQYESAGITGYVYTPPTSGTAFTNWPTLDQMISNGTRLVSFVPALSSNTAAPYLMDEWTYIFENPYDVTSSTGFSCNADRPSSVQNNAASAIQQGMMPFMNHFLYAEQFFGNVPNVTYTPVTNAPGNTTGNLGLAAATCESQWGRKPTFILVDYFNVGPAIATVDRLNSVSSAVGRQSVSTTTPSASSGVGRVSTSLVVPALAITAVVFLIMG